MRKLQKGGSSSGLLGWAWRTNYILFERDTFRDGTGPEMVCVENKEKLPQKKAIKKTWRKILANPNLSQDNHNMGRCDHHIFRILLLGGGDLMTQNYLKLKKVNVTRHF